jgi:stage V sporulation protein S
MEDLFKVSAHSRPVSVAGAIAGTVRDGKAATLQAIGAGSVNQAVKAISIARGFLAKDGLDIICVPEFVELDIDGNERTAVRFHVNRPGSVFPPAKPIVKRETSVDNPPRKREGGHNGR